ncbi:NAD(P)/FAD-dependent oxidoreductase [Lysobacter sp. N42]|nr:NAD(P)/FAD-dependent oxidoreductase [Aliidiomarina sp. B3213]TCZ90332.1 NAD(P)/FAD-dependent oxidoreductase [Lysobacter sp. N42]
MGIQLKEAGRHNFLILEKADKVGGTWRDNTYPGAACDVQSHLYSFSFAPKHDWSRSYAPQQEIFEYIENCVNRFELDPHIQFNAEVAKLEYQEQQCCWHVELTNGTVLESRCVVTATGQLNQPSYPNIEGLNEFQGECFHSARWNHNVDLTGKRVGVIGTGASAIQFVPEIAKQAESVTVFQRSAAWVIPKSDKPFTKWQKWCFKYIPGVDKLYRTIIYWKNEARALAFTSFSGILKFGEQRARKMVSRDVTNPELQKALIPDYQIGCNRILLANNWYSTFELPHVNLTTAPIQRITQTGIETTESEPHNLDVLILGTGFKATELLSPMHIVGLNGQTLNEAWQDGAEAFKGISVSGFPNLFMLYGPNTNLSHSSIIFMLESQMHYVLHCLNKLDKHNALAMDVKAETQRRYNEELQGVLKKTVWASGCNSWYLNEKGKNVVNWYGFTFYYRLVTKRVRTQDYIFTKES